MWKDRFKQWYEGQVDKNVAVFGMIDDVHQLFGEQARVNGVQYRTKTRNTVIQLKVAIVVPCQCGYTVAVLNIKASQQVSHFTGTAGSVFHGVTVNITFTATAYNFSIRVGRFRMLQQC